MSREEANGYVLEFLRHYEDSHKDPPPGKPFSQIYKLDPLGPTDEWLDIYNKVSDAVVDTGLDIRNKWKQAKQ
jgi:hypothetical protein